MSGALPAVMRNEKHACVDTRVRRMSELDFFSRNFIKASHTPRRDGIMNSLRERASGLGECVLLLANVCMCIK